MNFARLLLTIAAIALLSLFASASVANDDPNIEPDALANRANYETSKARRTVRARIDSPNVLVVRNGKTLNTPARKQPRSSVNVVDIRRSKVLILNSDQSSEVSDHDAGGGG